MNGMSIFVGLLLLADVIDKREIVALEYPHIVLRSLHSYSINMHQTMDTTVFAFFFFSFNDDRQRGNNANMRRKLIRTHICRSQLFRFFFWFCFHAISRTAKNGRVSVPSSHHPRIECRPLVMRNRPCSLLRCFVQCHRHNQLLIDRIKACSQQSNISLSSLIL